ncbi:MAG: hypothetical protein IH586_16580 [Anaerolineaceae bacterium]|nr:hypothetical protein [Anaerolineaceae bacterium]
MTTQGKVTNIYMHNLLVSLDPRGKQVDSGVAKMTLSEFLASLEIEPVTTASEKGGEKNEGAAAPVDAPQVIEGVQPLALIIDQFEEIFSTHPEAWKQRGPFFEQLCQAMEADPYLWVILAIREDYVAALDPYAYLFPDRLRARFYMQRMEYNAALDAVKKPVADLRPFEEGVAEELVDNLRRIPLAESKDDNQARMVESQYVEPVQLQVVCYQLWEQLKSEPGERITAADLARLARGGDLAQFISRSLGEFYEQAILTVAKDLSTTMSERQLREWFSKELITESETRGSVFQGETKTGSLPNKVVSLLEAQFIVRSETRPSGKWYELSHDRFIAPILQANRTWNERHPRPVQADAEAWAAANRPRKKLYEGRQLESALQHLDSSPGEWSELEREFIQASQAAADRQRTRRQGVGIALMALLVILLGALTINSLNGWRQATANEGLAKTEGANVLRQKQTVDQALIQEAKQAQTANAARSIANEQAQLAEGQRLTAVAYSEQLGVQSTAAENARATAVSAGLVAAQERDKAEAARNQAQAGRLASLSDNFRNNNLDLSLLLSIEAVNLNDNWNTRGPLLSSVQRGIKNSLSREGTPLSLSREPSSVAISPDGELLAAGQNDGIVSVVYMNGRARVEGIPDSFKSKFTVYTVAFSSDSQVLAQGNGGGSVVLWKRGTDQISRFFPFKNTFPYIYSLAFQPDGDLLAIGTQREQETGKGAVVLYNYKLDRVERTWDCGAVDCVLLAWSTDGKKLAVVNRANSIKIFDLAQNRETRAIDRAHTDTIFGLAWYPDNQRLVTGGLDRRLVQWDTQTGNIILESDRLDTQPVFSLAISPNGRYLLVGTGGQKQTTWASLWDAESLSRLDYPLNQQNSVVSGVTFNPQGNRFVTASLDKTLVIWKFEPIDPMSEFITSYKGGDLETIAEDSSGNLVVTQYAIGNTVIINNQAVEKPVSFVALHSSAAAFSLDGKQVIGLGNYEGQVVLYDTATGKAARDPVKIGNGSLRSLAATAKGELIAGAVCKGSTQCGEIVIWDVKNNQALEISQTVKDQDLGIVTAMAFSPDQDNLAIGNDDGQILIYHLKGGTVDQAVTEGLNLQNINLVIESLAFGPEGSDLLAAGFNDGRVALWQASARVPIGQFDERMNGEVTALFIRNGKGGLKLAAASGRGELREYDVDILSWQQRACLLTNNHNLTTEERKKFLPDSDPDAVTCPR